MTTKLARRSFGDPYECQKPWPEDAFVQCGDTGMVFTDTGLEEAFADPDTAKSVVGAAFGIETEKPPPAHYTTAFFEAFPDMPGIDGSIFLRGEGKTVAEAEQQAWEKYQKHLACPGHEFERRGYTNGGGFCKHCNMFKGKVFEPLETSVLIVNGEADHGHEPPRVKSVLKATLATVMEEHPDAVMGPKKIDGSLLPPEVVEEWLKNSWSWSRPNWEHDEDFTFVYLP